MLLYPHFLLFGVKVQVFLQQFVLLLLLRLRFQLLLLPLPLHMILLLQPTLLFVLEVLLPLLLSVFYPLQPPRFSITFNWVSIPPFSLVVLACVSINLPMYLVIRWLSVSNYRLYALVDQLIFLHNVLFSALLLTVPVEVLHFVPLSLLSLDFSSLLNEQLSVLVNTDYQASAEHRQVVQQPQAPQHAFHVLVLRKPKRLYFPLRVLRPPPV